MTGPVPLIKAMPIIPGVWKGLRAMHAPAVATGLASLDAALPGSGWPLGAVTELIPLAEGIGELSILIPALRKHSTPQRPLIFVRPPHVLSPRALANAGIPLSRIVWIDSSSDEDGRWAAEQALRSGAASAVLVWTDTRADVAVRRIQIAATDTDSLAFVYRPPAALRSASPAAVRIVMRPNRGGVRLDVVKARGGHAGTSVPLPRSLRSTRAA
jgi:hypothetical protein